ncbi:MAG: hypothetical protein H0X66_05845 [Verrucomicrobia bacterium]|nr:hypothetical protein [Verrucomicrobiota bacterium]
MTGKSRNFHRNKERHVLLIEVGLRQTKALQGIISGPAQIATGLWLEEPWLCEADGEIKLIPNVVQDFLARFSGSGEVVLIIDPSVSVRFVQNVPLTTEKTIHEHLRQAVAKTERIDLATYFWTVTPLSVPHVNEKELTAATFQERSAVLSATKKKWLDEMKAQVEAVGWKLKQVLFQQACVIRAFQLFGGTALEKETVGLLHFSHSRYSLALLQNGIWICHRDGQVRGTSRLRDDIKTYLAGTLSHFRIQARCLFVSVDGAGAELLANELKENGSYARTWNALRKITVETGPETRENILSDGTQFNSLVGAMLIVADCSQPDAQNKEISVFEQVVETSERLFGRPLKIAACLALLASGYLWYLNSNSERQFAQLEAKLKKQEQRLEKFQSADGSPEKRLAELDAFRSSRTFWPGVVAQIRSLNVDGVSLSQVRISDTLIPPDKNPFETHSAEKRRWQNSGSMIVEARNVAGIGALENFMNAVKANGYIRPLLHKKKPARVLNNIEIVDTVSPATLFTVEYPLQDKTL